jgi:hypothetical protein
MREFLKANAQRCQAIGAALMAASMFMSVLIVIRVLSLRPQAALPAIWPALTTLFLGGLASAGCWLLEVGLSRRPQFLERLLLRMAAAGWTIAAVLATTVGGSTWSLAIGCVASVGGLAWAVASSISEPSAAKAVAQNAATPASISEPANAQADQTWRRWAEGDRDCLEGCVRVDFAAGQSTAVIHVPLQPAMSAIPDVETEPMEDCELRVSADPVLPYGVRLTCRRSGGLDQPLRAGVAVHISAPMKSARAA